MTKETLKDRKEFLEIRLQIYLGRFQALSLHIDLKLPMSLNASLIHQKKTLVKGF